MDERYKSHNIDISKWLNNRKKIYDKVKDLERDLAQFYTKNGCVEEAVFSKPVFK